MRFLWLEQNPQYIGVVVSMVLFAFFVALILLWRSDKELDEAWQKYKEAARHRDMLQCEHNNIVRSILSLHWDYPANMAEPTHDTPNLAILDLRERLKKDEDQRAETYDAIVHALVATGGYDESQTLLSQIPLLAERWKSKQDLIYKYGELTEQHAHFVKLYADMASSAETEQRLRECYLISRNQARDDIQGIKNKALEIGISPEQCEALFSEIGKKLWEAPAAPLVDRPGPRRRRGK